MTTSRLQKCAAYPLFSKLNEITSVLQMSVTNQQEIIKKIFPLKLKNKAVCTRFSDQVILNTVSSKFRFAVCKCWFWNPSAVIFSKFYRPTVLNFNMNKRQNLILVLRNLVLNVFVTQQIMIHSPLAYRVISKMYKQGKTTSTA